MGAAMRRIETGIPPPGSLAMTSPQLREAIHRLCGVRLPARTLAGWAKSGLVVPSHWPQRRGRWNVRRYSLRDAKRVRLIVELRRAGMSTLRIRRALDYLDKHHPTFDRRKSPLELIVAGTREPVILVRDADAPDVSVPEGQAVFRFDLHELSKGTRRAAVSAGARMLRETT